MKKKEIIFSLMALAMLSTGGFFAAKLINQNNLSDQILENIEAISYDVEFSNGTKGRCESPWSNICGFDIVAIPGVFYPY